MRTWSAVGLSSDLLDLAKKVKSSLKVAYLLEKDKAWVIQDCCAIGMLWLMRAKMAVDRSCLDDYSHDSLIGILPYPLASCSVQHVMEINCNWLC